MKEYDWKKEREKYLVDSLKKEPEQSAQVQQVESAPRRRTFSPGKFFVFLLLIVLVGLAYWSRESLFGIFESPNGSFEKIAEKYKHAVGTVVLHIEKNGQVLFHKNNGTAWAFSPTEFATNAHVAAGLWKNKQKIIQLLGTKKFLNEQKCATFQEFIERCQKQMLQNAIDEIEADVLKMLLKEEKSATLEQLTQKIGKTVLQKKRQELIRKSILEKYSCTNEKKFLDLMKKKGTQKAQLLFTRFQAEYKKDISCKVFILINQTSEKYYTVQSVQSHPRYTSSMSPDVAVLTVEKPHSSYFKLASDQKLQTLKTGRNIATLGFPAENLVYGNVNLKSPIATFQQGNIIAVSDFELKQATPANSFWIRHNLPCAGGSSGSPIFDRSGEVIALLNSGPTHFVETYSSSGKELTRIDSAAMVNGAVRVDLLKGVGERIPINKWLSQMVE